MSTLTLDLYSTPHRVFNHYPKGKAVYIAPLKALVRERVKDWRIRFQKRLGKK